MFTLFWKWAVSFFTADKIGVLVRRLFISAAKPVVSELLLPENQKKAYEFVKGLRARTDLTNSQKAKEFNRAFMDWAKKQGKTVALSVVNCLRELAVNALKAESPDTAEDAGSSHGKSTPRRSARKSRRRANH